MADRIRRLLMVDDRPDNLFVLRQVLSAYLTDCEVLTATSAEQGLQLAGEQPCDGALIDMQMPGLDGIEMCRRLKQGEATSTVPVILITAHHAPAELRARGLEAGADDFIERPIDNIELVARIRTILRIKDAEDRLRAGKAELERQVTKQTAMLREYQKAVENSSDLISVIDRHFRYSMVNEAWLGVYGKTRNQVVGRKVVEIRGEECFERHLRALLERCMAGESVEFEYEFSQEGEKARQLSARLTPIAGEDGVIEGVVSTIHDMTREREAEKMKDEFISVAAHELSTPLAVIQGYAELLRDELADAPYSRKDRQEFLSLILEKCDRLQALTDDLLDLRRVDSGWLLGLNKSRWSLKDELDSHIRLLQRTTGTHRFELNYSEACDEVLADRGKFGQVLENLLGNAIKYSPEGGLISLTAACEDDELRVSVADQGIGMTDEEARRAFEKFYRANTLNTAAGGLGLGLSIARGIIEAHKGKIWMESEVGKGTAVHFTLPLKQEAESLLGEEGRVLQP